MFEKPTDVLKLEKNGSSITGDNNFFEDTSDVTLTELRGYYMFGFASEGYSGLSLVVLAPLIIRGLAADVGYDNLSIPKYSLPCNTSNSSYSCSVKIGSSYIDTGSFYYYVTSLCSVLQLFFLLGSGALADHGEMRKSFMITCGTIACIASLAFLVIVNPSLYWLGAIFYMIGAIAFYMSYTFYYAFIPVLARYHPIVTSLRTKSVSSSQKNDEISSSYHEALDKATNEISSKSFSIMYFGSVCNLIIGLGIVYVTLGYKGFPTSQYGAQIAMASQSIWWLGFQMFSIKWMKPRPGPPLPIGTNVVTYSFIQAWKTLKDARKLPNLFKFLIGWFLYADAFSTLITVSLLFAQEELGASTMTILIVATLIPFCGALGTLFWFYLQKLTKISSKTILLIQIGVFASIPVYGCIGFIPGITFGFKKPWEMYLYSVWFGLVIGATQSCCRSIFSEMLPTGRESEFFALYEITDKGASWIGPLVVAAIIDGTGIRRNAFWFLLVSFIIPAIIFINVDSKKGHEEAKKLVAVAAH